MISSQDPGMPLATAPRQRLLTPYAARLAVTFALTLTAAVAINAIVLQRPAPPGSDQAALALRAGGGKTSTLDGVVTGEGKAGGQAGLPIKTSGIQPVPSLAQEMKRWQERLRKLEADAAREVRSASSSGPELPPAGVSTVDLEPPIAHRLDNEPVTPVTQKTVRAIQRELAQRGYDPGPVDGNIGLLTHAAIMAYEHDEQLMLTGEPSERLLRRLLLGVSGDDASASGRADGQTAERVVKGVQMALASLKYAPGATTGSLTEDTTRAIREFEMDQGLVPTGRISGRLIVRLARASGRAFVLPAR